MDPNDNWGGETGDPIYNEYGQPMIGQAYTGEYDAYGNPVFVPIYDTAELNTLGQQGYTVTNYGTREEVRAADGATDRVLWQGGAPTSLATPYLDPYGGVVADNGDVLTQETNRNLTYGYGTGGGAHPYEVWGHPEYIQDGVGGVDGDGDGSSDSGGSSRSGRGWVDYNNGYGGRSGGGYGRGSSSGDGGYGTDYYGAMRGAGLNAGAMGRALRGAMGAPIPQMPGQYEDEEDGYRRPAYVPGGASVDSYGNPSPAPTPSGEGRYPPWPGASRTGLYGGGGSAPAQAPSLASARGRIQGAMDRVRGAVGGFSGGGYSGGGSSGGGYSSGYSSGGYPAPAPSSGSGRGARMPTENMTGWAKRQGYNAATAMEILPYHPEAALSDAVPGLKTGDPMFNTMANLPVDPSAMMMLSDKATSKKNWTPGASDLANSVNNFYDDFAAGKQASPDQMLQNLSHIKKGSALDEQLSGLGPEGAAYTLGNYFASVVGAMPPSVGAAYQNQFNNFTTDYLGDALRANPKNVPSITKSLRREF